MRDRRFYKVVVVAATILIIMLVVGTIGAIGAAQVQGDDCIQLYVNGGLEYESAACDVTEPTPTAEATDAPTATPEPTVAPTPTDEPTGNGQPDPDDPACDSHDDRAWHALHDPVRDCHYDHAHGMPQPSWVGDVFGDTVADMLWTVSYEWETPNENAQKHAGYVMHAYDFRDEDCVGVDAYAAQTHGLGIGLGKLARFHSFALAASLCDGDGDAGTIFTAGHEDYGQLMSPYKEEFVSYPRFPEQLYSLLSPPYVGEGRVRSVGLETWNSSHRNTTAPYVDEHEIAGIAFRIRRVVDYVDPETRLTGNPVFIPFGNADSNSSAYQLYQIEVSVPDLNGDGSRVTGTWWTDVRGNLRDDCNEPAENCVPLILNDAKPGSYAINATLVGYISSNHRPEGFYDHDIYFDGQPSGWIDLSSFGQ